MFVITVLAPLARRLNSPGQPGLAQDMAAISLSLISIGLVLWFYGWIVAQIMAEDWLV